jgi:hypothetical protein
MDSNLIMVATGTNAFILPQRLQSGAKPFPLHHEDEFPGRMIFDDFLLTTSDRVNTVSFS